MGAAHGIEVVERIAGEYFEVDFCSAWAVGDRTRAQTGFSLSPVMMMAQGVMRYGCFASSKKAQGCPVSSIWVGLSPATFTTPLEGQVCTVRDAQDLDVPAAGRMFAYSLWG